MAKKKLRHKKSVYSDFGVFLARAIEIAKEKIIAYNTLVDLAIRKKSFNTFLKVQISILERVGWKAFLAIALLTGTSGYFYYGSISAMLASNPLLSFALLSVSGGAVFLIYKNREFVAVSKDVGERYKIDFDFICIKHVELEDRAGEIEVLMKKCVESLISELLRISLEEANKKYRIGNTRQQEISETSGTKAGHKLFDKVKGLFDRIKSIFVKDIDPYQSLEDIARYLSGWLLVLEKTTVFLEADKQELITNLYWENVNKDIKSIFIKAYLFFKTAIIEVDEIQKEILKEVQPHHVSRLKRISNTSREISVEWSRVWKIIYKAKKYRDPNFLILEKMCDRSRDLATSTMKFSSIADRLNDYVGRKNPGDHSATNGENINVNIDGDFEGNIAIGKNNSISNKAAIKQKDEVSKAKRKPKQKDRVPKAKPKLKQKGRVLKAKRKLK